MRIPFLIVLFCSFCGIVDAQLSAVYSDVTRTSSCSSWSSWGTCVWPDPSKNKKTYLEQLTAVCQSHWFYKFVRRYEKALNSFFDYLHSVLRPQNGDASKPCGYCSYKQSCGFGGKEQCNLSPFEIPGGRALMPFFVSEKVCNRRDLRGHDQGNACELDYDLLKENGRECQLWPSPQVDLSSVEAPFRQQLNELKWYSCTPETKFDKNGKKYVVCRCCCFPFKVSPDDNFKCVYDHSLQPAPGMNEL